MSLLAGIWSFNGKSVGAESLIPLAQTAGEHGSDRTTTYVTPEVAMLYQSFHTTAESRLESQPFVSSVGNVFTFDGRLDNREDLTRELCNHLSILEPTDVALVAAAFERWGCKGLAKLVGDWALAVWINGGKRLVLARDYIGIRPLFYQICAHRAMWCSQLGALVARASKLTLSEEYIAGYLAGLPSADLTPYEEIHSVPPGGFVQVDNRKSGTHHYWNFDPFSRIRYKTDGEYEEHFRHLFRQSVRRRLRTDCPILAGLSGGLDSSSIICVADEIAHSGEEMYPRVDTFSFCDRDEPEEDDFSYFTQVERRRGRTGHHAELIANGDSLPIAQFSFTPIPGFDERQELKAAMSDVLRQGQYRVLLSGIGGDEFLGQAFNPRIQLADLLLQCRPKDFVRSLMGWSLATRLPWLFLFLDTVVLFLPTAIRSALTSGHEDEQWINVQFARRHKFATRRLQAAEGSWWWPPKARDDYQTYATISRQMTYFSSSTVETRYPFLDQTLAEFLWSVPATQIARPGEPRFLMRRALKDVLPPEILSRKTKASAGRCIALTFQKHKDSIAEALHSPVTSRLGYIELDGFKRTVGAIANGQIPFQIVQFLKALALEFWIREAVARNIISVNV